MECPPPRPAPGGGDDDGGEVSKRRRATANLRGREKVCRGGERSGQVSHEWTAFRRCQPPLGHQRNKALAGGSDKSSGRDPRMAADARGVTVSRSWLNQVRRL